MVGNIKLLKEFNNQWNWSSNQKVPNKQKPWTEWLHRWILPNIQRRTNTYPSQTISKNSREGKTPKLILPGQQYHSSKARKGHYKKRKLQVNITDEHRCQNPQQNIREQNTAMHQKDHPPWSSGIYSGHARLVQHFQINKCDISPKKWRLKST